MRRERFPSPPPKLPQMPVVNVTVQPSRGRACHTPWQRGIQVKSMPRTGLHNDVLSGMTDEMDYEVEMARHAMLAMLMPTIVVILSNPTYKIKERKEIGKDVQKRNKATHGISHIAHKEQTYMCKKKVTKTTKINLNLKLFCFMYVYSCFHMSHIMPCMHMHMSKVRIHTAATQQAVFACDGTRVRQPGRTGA